MTNPMTRDLLAQEEANRANAKFRRSPGSDIPVYEAFPGIMITGPNGSVTLGNRSYAGRFAADWYRLTAVDGLWDLPGVRQTRQANPDTHGQSGGALSLDERVLAFEGVIEAGNLRGLRAMERQMKSVLTPRRTWSGVGGQCYITLAPPAHHRTNNEWPTQQFQNLLMNPTARTDLANISSDTVGISRITTGGVYSGFGIGHTTLAADVRSGAIFQASTYLKEGDQISAGIWMKLTNLGGATNYNMSVYAEFLDDNGQIIAPYTFGKYNTFRINNPLVNKWMYLQDVWDVPAGAKEVQLRVEHFRANGSSNATWIASDAMLTDTLGVGSNETLHYQVGYYHGHSDNLFSSNPGITDDLFYVGPIPHNLINDSRGSLTVGFGIPTVPTNWVIGDAAVTPDMDGFPTPPSLEWFDSGDGYYDGPAFRVVPDSSGGSIQFGAVQPVTPRKHYYLSTYVCPDKDTVINVSALFTNPGQPGDNLSMVIDSTTCPGGQWTKLQGVFQIPANKSHATVSVSQPGAYDARFYFMQPMWCASPEAIPYLDKTGHGFHQRETTTSIPQGAIAIQPGVYQLRGDVADMKFAQRHEASSAGRYQLPFMLTIKCGDPRIYESNVRRVEFDFPTIPVSVVHRPSYDYGINVDGVGYTQQYRAYDFNIDDPAHYVDVQPAANPASTIDWGTHVWGDGTATTPVPPFVHNSKIGGLSWIPDASASSNNSVAMAAFATKGPSWVNAGSYDAYRAGCFAGVIAKALVSGERLEAGIGWFKESSTATASPYACVVHIRPVAPGDNPYNWRADVLAKWPLLGSEWTNPGLSEYWIRAGIFSESNWPGPAGDWSDMGWGPSDNIINMTIHNGRPSPNVTDETGWIWGLQANVPASLNQSVAGRRGWVLHHWSALFGSYVGSIAFEDHLISNPPPQSKTIEVRGDVESPPTVRFLGAMKDPRVTINGNPIALRGHHGDTAQAFIDSQSGDRSLSLMTIDPSTRRMELQPGLNTITAEATGTNAGFSKIAVEYRPAWS